MKDAIGAPVLGGTKWKRFAIVMVPTTVVAGAMTVAMAQGAIASSMAISGDYFKVSASELDGTNFQQTGRVLTTDAGPEAVAEAGISSATIHNMCQSVSVTLPLNMGHLVVVLKAGADPKNPVTATDLVIDSSQLNADAVFTGVQIGVDAGTLTGVKGFNPDGQANGHFGQLVQQAVLTDVKQTAWATTAGTFKLSGLSLSAGFDPGQQCFQ